MRHCIKILFILAIFFVFTQKTVEARSGCCSSHGGVCGCNCCDGSSLSATCTPYYTGCNKPIRIERPTPTPMKMSLTIKFKKILSKFIRPTATPTPKVKIIKNIWPCNCNKTCPKMSSCDEAQYQLNVCGCRARDADNDGIACDNQCQ